MRQRIQQIIDAWRMTAQRDPRLIPWVAGTALVVLAAVLVPALFFIPLPFAIALGLFAATFAALIVFGRRAQSAQISEIEGVPGAAAAVLQSMRGQWFVTPVVAFNRNQDMVHRVVGRPGVILVGEGSRSGVKQLLAKEKKKMGRVTGDDVPVHTLVIGDREDEVELGDVQWRVSKLSRELSKTEVPKLERKLKPLDKGNIPMPKGYLGNQGRKLQ